MKRLNTRYIVLVMLVANCPKILEHDRSNISQRQASFNPFVLVLTGIHLAVYCFAVHLTISQPAKGIEIISELACCVLERHNPLTPCRQRVAKLGWTTSHKISGHQLSLSAFTTFASASFLSNAPGSVGSTPRRIASATSSAGPVNHLLAHTTHDATAPTAMIPTATGV